MSSSHLRGLEGCYHGDRLGMEDRVTRTNRMQCIVKTVLRFTARNSYREPSRWACMEHESTNVLSARID